MDGSFISYFHLVSRKGFDVLGAMRHLICRHLLPALALSLVLSSPLAAQSPATASPQSLALTQQADAAAGQKNIPAAEKLYLQAVELDSKNGKAWRGLAKITAAKGELNKAISFLKEGWSNGDSASLKALGALLIQEGKYEEFDKIIPDLLSLKGSDVEARSLLVFYNLKSGKIDRSLLEESLSGLTLAELKTKNDDTLVLIIQGYDTLGKTQEAANVREILKGRGGASATKAQN